MARKLEGPSHQLIDKICDKTEGALWPLIMAQLANWRWHRRHTFSRCARIVVDIHYDGHYHQDLIDYQMAVSIKIFYQHIFTIVKSLVQEFDQYWFFFVLHLLVFVASLISLTIMSCSIHIIVFVIHYDGYTGIGYPINNRLG